MDSLWYFSPKLHRKMKARTSAVIGGCLEMPFLILNGFPFNCSFPSSTQCPFFCFFPPLFPTGALLPLPNRGGKEGAAHVQHSEKEGSTGERNAQGPPPSSATHPLWKCRCYTWILMTTHIQAASAHKDHSHHLALAQPHGNHLQGSQLVGLKLFISCATNILRPIQLPGNPRSNPDWLVWQF